MSPMSRSLEHLRKLGYHCEIVEHYNSFSRKRHDLWGWADILALGPLHILAVQTTTKSNMLARQKKILVSETFPMVRALGVMVAVHGWGKIGGRWQVVIKELA